MSNGEGLAESRLDNLQNIEPLLASLRVLSSSTMQMAGNRKVYLNTYRQNFLQILAHLNAKTKRGAKKSARQQNADGSAVLVIVGSDRGMCGTYNKTLASQAAFWLAEQTSETKIIAFGSRLSSSLRQNNVLFEDGGTLSTGSLPDYQKAHDYVTGWLEGFTNHELKSVEILAFRKRARGPFKPRIERLIPQELITEENAAAVSWPEPIIEGNPRVMIEFVYDHLASLVFQEIILESIEAENTIRYNLLEEAKENIEELIEALTMEVQAERRQAITEQLQELVASAALGI